MKKTMLLIAAAVVFVAAGCTPKQKTSDEAKSVRVDTVAAYSLSQSVTFPGKILAASDMNLAFRVSGPILRMNVDVGSYVRRGQVLAQIDPRDYEVQLAATEAEYNRIKSESERVMELYEMQSVAPNDYDKAVYGLKQITAKYDAHKNALKDTRLVAPSNGYVQKRYFEAGETVSAGMPVISMINAAVPEVEINIPSTDYIRRGDFHSFVCTVDIYPGREFPLELIGITQKANMNQLYTMRLRLSGQGKDLPGPGMSTMVTIYFKDSGTASAPASVSAPLEAVFEGADGSSVWVYDSAAGTVSQRTVKVSQILTNGTAVISEGLRAGDVIVSAGVHSLAEGDRVEPLAPVSPTNVGGLL